MVKSGLMNHIVIAQAQVMPIILDKQLRSLRPKQLKKLTEWCWPKIGSAPYHGSNRIITWTSSIDFE